MTDSPFPANATAIFTKPTGTLVTDPATGNRQPGQITVEIQLYLSPESGNSNRLRDINYPGTDEAEEALKGRLVDPMHLPPGIGNKAWCEIKNLVTDTVEKSGWLTISRPTPSAFEVEEALGALVKCTFRAIAPSTSAPTLVPQPTPGDYPAGESIDPYRLVSLTSGGLLVLADSGDVTQVAGAIGVTLNGAAIGARPQIVTAGLITNSGWSWTVGRPVFVGVNGLFTQSPTLTGEGYLQPVGVAVKADQIWLEIEESTLL